MTADLRDPEQLAVPVRGGDLAVLRWAAADPGAPVVALVHGITSNAMIWRKVARALAGECTVVVPDLRGRAGSAGLPGPYGVNAHADDLLAVLDAVGADRAVLAGHSMGAFVVAMAAASGARQRTRGLVLVDGGLALPDPPGADIDAKLSAFLGPTLDRLGLTWPDAAAVGEFWAAHPAVGPWAGDPDVRAWIERDLRPADGGLRSTVVEEAVRVDGGEILLDREVLEATAELPVPATLLWAPRGLQDQSPGLYDTSRLSLLGLDRAGITAHEVPGTNHYSILWTDDGVRAVADAVRAAAR